MAPAKPARRVSKTDELNRQLSRVETDSACRKVCEHFPGEAAESSHAEGESDIKESERNSGMPLILSLMGIAVLAMSLVFVLRAKRLKGEREMEQHSITAEELHALLASDQEILLFDVRQPLDLLAFPEIIPKAKRIAPNEVLERPSLIPKEKDAVVYCTCPSDKTSRTVLRRALALQFFRVKFLRGGLAAWKAKGYPVEPYREVFHLYVPTLAPRSG
jgi:rhodanese-related sulfurtransferase